MTRAAFLLCIAMTSGAAACPTPPTAMALMSQTETAPLAYVEMDAPPLSAPFAMTVTFCDTADKAEALTFDALMPAHQHGMNFRVDVANIADNRFEVSNVVFHMPGLWEIRVQADISGQRYSYRAEVPLE